MQEYQVSIQEALGWVLEKDQTLRRAIILEARKETLVEGNFRIVVEGDQFIAKQIS